MPTSPPHTTLDDITAIANGRLIIVVAYQRVTADEHDGRYVIAARDIKVTGPRSVTAIVDVLEGAYTDERGIEAINPTAPATFHELARALNRHADDVRADAAGPR